MSIVLFSYNMYIPTYKTNTIFLNLTNINHSKYQLLDTFNQQFRRLNY